jgi:hypothetical protein
MKMTLSGLRRSSYGSGDISKAGDRVCSDILTVILKLLLPEGVDQVTFEVIGRVFE